MFLQLTTEFEVTPLKVTKGRLQPVVTDGISVYSVSDTGPTTRMVILFLISVLVYLCQCIINNSKIVSNSLFYNLLRRCQCLPIP